MVTVRSGQGTPGARLSHSARLPRSDMCTAGSWPFTRWSSRNITAWLAWPSAGVNQNSSVHPVRRCRTAGLNGPAEAAIAANVSYPASAPSMACVRRNSGQLADGSAHGHTQAQHNQDTPAGDDAGHEPAWLGRHRAIGPHQGVRDARAEQQGAACDRTPGDRVRRRFCRRTPTDTAAAARNPLDEHVPEQSAKYGSENGHAGPAYRWKRSTADEHACRALHAAGRPGEVPPPMPRYPQCPPDGRGVIEAAYTAIQLACPGHGEGHAAADGTAGGDGRYDLINADHPARLRGI